MCFLVDVLAIICVELVPLLPLYHCRLVNLGWLDPVHVC